MQRIILCRETENATAVHAHMCEREGDCEFYVCMCLKNATEARIKSLLTEGGKCNECSFLLACELELPILSYQ